jgi:hypothetical protein
MAHRNRGSLVETGFRTLRQYETGGAMMIGYVLSQNKLENVEGRVLETIYEARLGTK